MSKEKVDSFPKLKEEIRKLRNIPIREFGKVWIERDKVLEKIALLEQHLQESAQWMYANTDKGSGMRAIPLKKLLEGSTT